MKYSFRRETKSIGYRGLRLLPRADIERISVCRVCEIDIVIIGERKVGGEGEKDERNARQSDFE